MYYSGDDSVLEESQSLYTEYHDPSQPDQLGYTGPGSGNGVKHGQNTMPPSVIAVDCSSVINTTVCAEFQSQGDMPSGLGHSQHNALTGRGQPRTLP